MVFIIFALLLSVGCRASGQSVPSKSLPNAGPRVIDAQQAVRIAERFVRENGYTDFVPPDASKLVPESIEFSGRDEWLAERHDTLRPRARGYLKGGRNDPKGWTVGFELVKPLGDERYGLAVTMDEHGENVRLQHMGFNLQVLRPRPQ
jgi:hypothetical protein